MNDMDRIIDLNFIAQQALETMDGYKQDIARVDDDIRKADKRLKQYMAKHEDLVRGFKADRRQRVRNLAAFKESVRDELSSIRVAMAQRLKE